MNITDEGALLIRVNRHKNNYDGSVCARPSMHECGANPSFRQRNCAKGSKDCFDINLFHHKDPMLIKTVDETIRPFFDKQIELIKAGWNPIMFFYTFGSNRNDPSRPVVGAYIVKEISVIENYFSKDDVYIYPEKIIKVPSSGMLKNDFLYQRSNGDPYLLWCRQVYRSAVFPFLEQMASILQDSSPADYEFLSNALNNSPGNISIGKLTDGEQPDLSMPEPGQESKEKLGMNVSKSASPEDNPVIGELKERFNHEVDEVIKIAAQAGFYYPRDLVANLHNSLLTNPFLILSGISGGGKTSFAIFYARALNAAIKVVSVRPDWTSPGHLLGFYDPFSKCFVPSETTSFINEAIQAYEAQGKDAPLYILLLDEMNLSRVEYYFSDFLSKMQLPDPEHRVIRLCEEEKLELRIPPNLKIIGTVNIDETTFLFSPKVLDRATYVFLNQIDIDGMGRVLENRQGDFHHLSIIKNEVLPELITLNAKLNEFGLPFGYRTVWEIIRWIDSALSVGIIPDALTGLDLQIESRIISKLSGNRRDPLFQTLLTFFLEHADARFDNQVAFPKSVNRLEALMNRAEREEFAIGQQ